jgi:hypothetical protein
MCGSGRGRVRAAVEGPFSFVEPVYDNHITYVSVLLVYCLPKKLNIASCKLFALGRVKKN